MNKPRNILQKIWDEHLIGPLMAAAAAVTGNLTDLRKFPA